AGRSPSAAPPQNPDPTRPPAEGGGERGGSEKGGGKTPPPRRYDTANALARDVQRYLSGDSVEACPPTLGYRLMKTYRRNRAAVLVGSILASVFLIATVVSVAFGIQANRAQREAEVKRQEADENRRTALANEERANLKSAALEVAQDRSRKSQYAALMSQASFALADNRVLSLQRLLAEAAPKPGEQDLRRWEWHYLDRL